MPLPLHRSSLLASLLTLPLVASSACGADPPSGAGGKGGEGIGGHGGATSATTTTTSATTTSATTTGNGGTGGIPPLPETFEVTGVVTDGEGPVEGAIVMQAGGTPDLLTGPDGKFSIQLHTAIPGIPAVVAAKIGYRSAGEEFSALPEGPIELAMRFVTLPDSTFYVFGDPGNGDPAHDVSTAYCGHCHTTQAKQFQASGHAEATRKPALQDLYAGVSRAHATQAACAQAKGQWRAGLVPGTSAESTFKCYLGEGVLPDLNPSCGAPGQASCDDPALDPAKEPVAFGRCADCHAAGIDGEAGGRDLHAAVGVSYDNGNHCDVCHHIRDVDLGQPPGVGGALLMQRSRDHLTEMPSSQLVQVLYGPLPDVPNTFMGGSYAPVFTQSTFCAGCHEQRQEALLPGTALDPLRWPDGLPTHSTFSEWAGSSFEAAGLQCQFCHMPPDDTGLKNSLDVTDETNASITFGYLRTPEQLRKHTFEGPLDGAPRRIDQALSLDLGAASDGIAIGVTAQVTNVFAGHAIPTGEPMRSLLLLVRAEACGNALLPSGGMTLDDWGGALAEGTVGADAAGRRGDAHLGRGRVHRADRAGDPRGATDGRVRGLPGDRLLRRSCAEPAGEGHRGPRAGR